MNLTQQRMVGWVTSAQRVEADALMSEVHFAAHESMGPMWIDREGSAEQIDVAVCTAAAQENHGAFERGSEIKRETFREAAPSGCEFSPGGGLDSIGCDITGGDTRQGLGIGEMVALPDLALPQRIKAFDGILEAGLARWGEYRDYSQRQTQPTDTSDSVVRLVRSLEYCGVVKLCIGGQPVTAPALKQGLQRGPSAGPLHDPGLGQCAVQAGAGEHIDKGASGNLQILDEIEAVELGSPTGQIGQIPALGRRRPAKSMRTIEQPPAGKYAVDRRARGRLGHAQSHVQRLPYGITTILTQYAVFAQRGTYAHDGRLQLRTGAVPRPPGRAVIEADPIEPLAFGVRDPVAHRAHADAKSRGNGAQALTRTSGPNDFSAPYGQRGFLAMVSLSTKQQTYTKRRTSRSGTLRGREVNGPLARGARGENSTRPSGSLRFPRATDPRTMERSTNAGTRVFN